MEPLLGRTITTNGKIITNQSTVGELLARKVPCSGESCGSPQAPLAGSVSDTGM